MEFFIIKILLQLVARYYIAGKIISKLHNNVKAYYAHLKNNYLMEKKQSIFRIK